MENKIKEMFYESADTLKSFIDENFWIVLECADVMKNALNDGGKLLFFGNGGSAADAQHLAAEFVNRFLIERGPLAARAEAADHARDHFPR